MSAMEQVEWETETLEDTGLQFNLILWNDDVNTFDWVITSLVEICSMSEIQAEQCALIVHNNGKCSVRSGSYDILKPMCNSITDRGINATVEQWVS